MTVTMEILPSSDRELVLARIIDALPEKLFRAWTEPELIKQWFTPRHWTVADREAHEKMGFHEGWGKATDQFAELVAPL